MGCRTHLRLAWSMQTTCKGLGKPQSKSARLPAIGVHPPHAEKAMQSSVMFPDRLLGIGPLNELNASSRGSCAASGTSTRRRLRNILRTIRSNLRIFARMGASLEDAPGTRVAADRLPTFSKPDKKQRALWYRPDRHGAHAACV